MSRKSGTKPLHKEWINFEQARDSHNVLIGAKCQLCKEILANTGETRMKNHL
jgi:hypothetical protein